MWAAQRGHTDAVRLFLACSASVCDVDGEGRSALMLSAEAGHAESAQLRLGSLAAVDDRCQYGMTALLYAASEGRTNTLGALLDGGADTNAHDDIFGMTPMMLAAAGNHVSSVSLLLERRARAEMKDSDGRTALMHAAERGCPEVVETLLRVCSAG
jgi:ankyrin repeat protein